MIEPITVNIPELSLVVLVGTSGAGKSTFARQHFQSTEIISSDYCRGLVSDDENDQSATKDAFEVLHFIASKRLKNGKMVVIDATNVQPEARKPLIQLARDHDVLPVAIVLDVSPDTCLERNKSRPDRNFPRHVILNQNRQLRQGMKKMKDEGFSQVNVLKGVRDIEKVAIQRVPLWNNRKHETGPFDIIGDVHGCFDELLILLNKLGYQAEKNEGRWHVNHPNGRKLIFVGDLVDRGPNTPEVLRFVMDAITDEVAMCVVGNHDDKLKRKLFGREVKIAHGLEQSLEQLAQETPEFNERVKTFLNGLISHYVLDGGKLAVAHAGIKENYIGRGSLRVRTFCMYGETTGEIDAFGLPVRYPWAQDYRGSTLVVYGHTPIPQPEWLNNTLNIDTGCVFGGGLTAIRYPEKELITVPAAQVYCEPIKPLHLPVQERPFDDLLDVADVTGKRVISTSLRQNITIKEAEAIAALEVMSRFAIDPHWLIYLPPTMSPTETSLLPDWLEYPTEAFSYYRNAGVEQVICEEKHMGSRAIVVVCKDEESARRRFGIQNYQCGVCYTRSGRSFFSNQDLEVEFINRIRETITKENLWDEFNTGWFCLDTELMPWSAKAQQLLEQQYANVGISAELGISKSLELIRQAEKHLPNLSELGIRFAERLQKVGDYRTAYRRYCWQVTDLKDYKLAPFHVLASEGSFNLHRDHLWHLEIINRLCLADPELFYPTAYQIVNTADEISCKEATDWWLSMTDSGGEGMVVKPLTFTVNGQIQPGVKCRGREYLRIIYGPEYTQQNHLSRLRSRALGHKRSLALREYALGYEALERFVNKEPLYRVHEAVFGVLALESEPVDPRL